MVEKVSDFKMPEKVVTRLLRDALPDSVVVSKDAKNAACRSASIFILQLSIAAAEKAAESNRVALENQDIIKAVTDLGLGEYAPQLVRFGAQRKRNAKRRETSLLKTKPQSKKEADSQETPESENGMNAMQDLMSQEDEDDSQIDEDPSPE